MVEYIEREAMKRALRNAHLHLDEAGIVIEIDDIPAADVQPVKHGQWILDYGGVPWNVIECSECGEKWHHWQGYAMPNYCSNCGARMDGAE